MSQIENGRLYTAREVQEYLKISRTTLWRLEKSGVLLPTRFVRDLRFRGEDLKKLAEGGAQ